VFLETGLPSFDTVVHNGAYTFVRTWQNCPNVLVEYFVLVRVSLHMCECVLFFVFFVVVVMHFFYSLCHVYGPSCLIQINVCMYVN